MNLWQDLIPLESLQCFSLALKAASVRGKRKNIILSFPSQLEKVSPAMLFPAVIISRNFLHSSRKCWAFKGKRAQFWLFRQDLSKAVVYESFCFPKSAAPKAERHWTCWVEMNMPTIAGQMLCCLSGTHALWTYLVLLKLFLTFPSHTGASKSH